MTTLKPLPVRTESGIQTVIHYYDDGLQPDGSCRTVFLINGCSISSRHRDTDASTRMRHDELVLSAFGLEIDWPRFMALSWPDKEPVPIPPGEPGAITFVPAPRSRWDRFLGSFRL